MTQPADDALAVLLLPGRLEGFDREQHARGLLSIPRVVALEPARRKPPGFLREAVCQRQARRLRFPGRLRMLVLYHPAQYPLARALCARYQDAELWYIPPEPHLLDAPAVPHPAELADLDALARERAARVLAVSADNVDDESLYERLDELDVISPRAFLPGAKSEWGRSQ